jgi:type I restriction enzyme S subunit
MEKDNNKPKLRFPGFTDPWEQRKLGDALSLLKDGTHGTHSDVDKGVYLLSAKNIKNGMITIDAETDRMISEEEYKKIHRNFQLIKGDVLLTIVGSIGESAIIENPGNITFQRSVAYLRPNDKITSKFLLATINTSKFQLELKNRQVVSAQPGIYLGVLEVIPFQYPTKVEQEKIGTFFQHIDSLITLHQRKLNHLQDKKKSLLQKMFPENGEDFPELRFPEFTDPWEQRKLGEVFNQTTEYVNPQAESIELWSLTVENGLTPKTDRYVRDFLVRKEDKYKAVRPNDIVYNPMNMTLGAIGYNNMSEIVAVSGYYVTMKPTDLIDGYYIKTWMQRPHSINLYKMCATGSLIEKQRVQYPTFAEINFTLPEIEEQKKIGAYFRNIDNLIILHQRKLNHLKEQKKALLQQMFV